MIEETKRFVVAKAQLDVAIGPNGESFSDANDENGIESGICSSGSSSESSW